MKLDEFCEFINGGAWSDKEYVSDGIPVVKVTNMVNGTITNDVSSFLPQNSFYKYKKHILSHGDLVVTTVGSHPTQPGSVVGRTAVIPKEFDGAFLNQNAVCIRVKREDLVSPEFLRHLAKTAYFKSYIESRARGSANQVRMAIGELKKFHFNYPSLPVQKKIAAILSAYNDLIENNNKRIALLEKAAEEIYREWFVRMRFPGWEQVKFVKGVPDGWQVKKVKEIVARKNFGRIYRSHELFEEGKVIVIDQSTQPFLGFYDGDPEHIASEDNPIILFGDHSCKMEIIFNPFSLAENVIPFVSLDNIPVIFLYYLIKGIIETTEYKRHWTELINKEIYVPSLNLQTRYAQLVKSHLLQINSLKKCNKKLNKSRDLLLSRLISGKLPVEALDIRFPPSMIAQ